VLYTGIASAEKFPSPLIARLTLSVKNMVGSSGLSFRQSFVIRETRLRQYAVKINVFAAGHSLRTHYTLYKWIGQRVDEPRAG